MSSREKKIRYKSLSEIAHETGYLEIAGPSGTTFDYMLFGLMYGFKSTSLRELRLAVLTYFMGEMNHSFFEVLVASEPFFHRSGAVTRPVDVVHHRESYHKENSLVELLPRVTRSLSEMGGFKDGAQSDPLQYAAMVFKVLLLSTTTSLGIRIYAVASRLKFNHLASFIIWSSCSSSEFVHSY